MTQSDCWVTSLHKRERECSRSMGLLPARHSIPTGWTLLRHWATDAMYPVLFNGLMVRWSEEGNKILVAYISIVYHELSFWFDHTSLRPSPFLWPLHTMIKSVLTLKLLCLSGQCSTHCLKKTLHNKVSSPVKHGDTRLKHIKVKAQCGWYSWKVLLW